MADLNDPQHATTPATGPAPLPSVDELKTHATRAVEDARSSLGGLASEARDKMNAAVDGQKAAGADRLAGLAQAAQAAAGELEEKSPTVARVVRDAAVSVDRFAGDLRNSDVRDVIATVSSFARQQPVAFFAGSVLMGFALARFFKSEAPATAASSRDAAAGYRDWSSTHQM